jgi:ribose/xylose/arabinose/galactoside ABC-type transport system permease subunit
LPRAEGDRSRRFARARELGIYVVLLLLVAWFGAVTRNHAFVSKSNLVDLLRQSSILAVAAVGMTLVVLTGGIDLSVGSVMALVGVLAGLLARVGSSPGPCPLPSWLRALPASVVLPAVLMFGLAWGAGTATLITRLQIPPLIATLGTMSIGRGAVQWLTRGESVRTEVTTASWENLTWLGRGYTLGVPGLVIVATIVVAIGAFVLHRTTFGTWLYGIGCNEEACRLSGVDVRRVKLLAYAGAGAAFALAGVMNLGRQGYALPAAATGFELDVVTAVVLGGVSITGGEGQILGVVAGVLILGSLDNGLSMVGLQFYEILVVKGVVLLVAVALDRFLRRARDSSVA